MVVCYEVTDLTYRRGTAILKNKGKTAFRATRKEMQRMFRLETIYYNKRKGRKISYKSYNVNSRVTKKRIIFKYQIGPQRRVFEF